MGLPPPVRLQTLAGEQFPLPALTVRAGQSALSVESLVLLPPHPAVAELFLAELTAVEVELGQVLRQHVDTGSLGLAGELTELALAQSAGLVQAVVTPGNLQTFLLSNIEWSLQLIILQIPLILLLLL